MLLARAEDTLQLVELARPNEQQFRKCRMIEELY